MAVRDAGVSPGQVDAIVVGSVFGPPGVATRVQRGLGIGGVPVWTVENACASGTSAYHEAVEAVRLGRFGCVLVLGVDQLSTLFSGAIVPEATDPEGAASLPLPGLYALQAQRYLQEFGVSRAQLAAVAGRDDGRRRGRHGRQRLRGHDLVRPNVGPRPRSARQQVPDQDEHADPHGELDGQDRQAGHDAD